jgi:hypothetical protein
MDAHTAGMFPAIRLFQGYEIPGRQPRLIFGSREMGKYVYCIVLAGFFAVGCQKQASTAASEEANSADRSESPNAGTVELPVHSRFYLRFLKTLDSAKVKPKLRRFETASPVFLKP